jgi:rubrerythrin
MAKSKCELTKNDIILNLKEALNAEYKALEGYEDVLRLIKDKADVNKVEMIIADERKHVNMVEALIALINEYAE